MICSRHVGDPGKPVVWFEGVRSREPRWRIWSQSEGLGTRSNEGDWSLNSVSQKANLNFFCLFVLFRPSKRQLITLERAICFTQSINSSANLFQKHSHRHPLVQSSCIKNQPSHYVVIFIHRHSSHWDLFLSQVVCLRTFLLPSNSVIVQ